MVAQKQNEQFNQGTPFSPIYTTDTWVLQFKPYTIATILVNVIEPLYILHLFVAQSVGDRVHT